MSEHASTQRLTSQSPPWNLSSTVINCIYHFYWAQLEMALYRNLTEDKNRRGYYLVNREHNYNYLQCITKLEVNSLSIAFFLEFRNWVHLLNLKCKFIIQYKPKKINVYRVLWMVRHKWTGNWKGRRRAIKSNSLPFSFALLEKNKNSRSKL